METILEQYIYNIRNPETNNKDFRENVVKIGEILGMKIAQDLETKPKEVKTVLGIAVHQLIHEQPVLVTVLRAGLPLYQGLQEIFPKAESGFIGAMRDEETLEAEVSYVALPELKGKKVILADTMLATGGSMVETMKYLEKEKPSEIIVAAAIAAEQGIENVLKYNSKTKIYAAAVDPELNEKGYIVPGLGDAGDRCYGVKK